MSSGARAGGCSGRAASSWGASSALGAAASSSLASPSGSTASSPDGVAGSDEQPSSASAPASTLHAVARATPALGSLLGAIEPRSTGQHVFVPSRQRGVVIDTDVVDLAVIVDEAVA